MPSAVTTTTQSVTFSSAIVNKHEQEQNQQSQSELQRVEETQRVISTIPNFDGTGAGVKQYYTEVITLCREADPKISQQIKLQHLLNNLKPCIKLKVIDKNPKTVAEFLEYSKTEDLNTLISRDQNLSNFVSDNLTAVAHNVSSPTIGSQTYVAPPRT
ncbi:unnamed protein product [Didymodactylos carnosus]|uniref:Uncharacterized protein n=1 Tax=Didymodactylos carnosus TaxID=1234261 RepID=A0A815J8A9_9BILA|nr:unnamed protein product [Didymodactylos carnosus]CAF1375915.1 unnamed protein product [Didymodactylos carnosus]CAF4074181.1 unnamed protein product [Didymodactylos carnosus]CAF4266301.1 unnamed protein product [Didymodactylos carnosus]